MIIIKCSLHENFGDKPSNLFLGESITKTNVKLVNCESEEPSYMICGSLLQHAISNNIIWGSGFISENNIVKDIPEKIYAVRGKLTRNKLLKIGIDCPEVYGDPALLYPKFYYPKIEKKYKLGIVPHYIDKNNSNIPHFVDTEILIIDIMSGYENVIQQILSCERIVSSALHGIIISDAYKIPAMWIKFSNKVIGNGFKFRDYFSSVNRKEKQPFVVTEETTLKDFFNLFYPYEIKIDLDKLYQECPFKNE